MPCLQAAAIIVQAPVATAALWVVGCEREASIAQQAEAHTPGLWKLLLDPSIVMLSSLVVQPHFQEEEWEAARGRPYVGPALNPHCCLLPRGRGPRPASLPVPDGGD